MRTLSYALAASLLALGLAGQANTASFGFTDAIALLNASFDAVELPGTGTAVANGPNGGDHLSSPRIPAGALAMNSLEIPVPRP